MIIFMLKKKIYYHKGTDYLGFYHFRKKKKVLMSHIVHKRFQIAILILYKGNIIVIEVKKNWQTI